MTFKTPIRLKMLFSLFVFSLLSSTHPSYSQSRVLRFDHITTEQGLSQDIVVSIVQDQQGFMWFATENGLNRYDGYSIRVYKHNPRDSTSIPSNDVRLLFVDNGGTLWVFTSQAASHYDPDRDVFSQFATPGTATAACEDGKGNIWIGTTKGLHKLELRNQKLTLTTLSKAISVYSISKSGSGMLWMGTANGIYILDPRSDKIIRYEQALETAEVSAILEDSRGYLWFTQREGGLRRIDLRTQRTEQYLPDSRKSESLSDFRILKLYEDRHGNVWVGTFNGLERFDPDQNGFVHFRHDPDDQHSISADRVYAVYQDRDGAIWVGTYRGGVSRTDSYNQKFEHFYHSEGTGFPGNDVLSLREDSRGDLWLGTDKSGVTRFNSRSRQFELLFSDRGWGLTAALVEDQKGRIWIGTQGSGLMCYDRATNTVRQMKHNDNNVSSIAGDDIRALHVDRDGVLWIGLSDAGLDRYDEKMNSFSHFLPDKQHTNIGVWCIYEDRQGALWLGVVQSPSSGLYSFDRASCTFEIPGRSSSDSIFHFFSRVRAVHEDSKGIVWLGSWGDGLYRFDRGTRKVVQYTELDGLANNFIKGMLADSHENLWISTENGLSRFEQAKGTFKNFTGRDGLQSNFFWSGSFCKGKDGRLYFGGTNGFNAFYPDNIRDNPGIPPVVITRFTVLNEPMLLARSGSSYNDVTLTYEQDFFSFEFVGLNYTAPEKNQFAYKMEGFDKDWVHAGSRRYAAYTHLDPGQYVFRVKASNNDGVWNEEGASLSILILPPYWKTWWFRVLVVAVIASALYGFYVIRVRRLLEMERLRSRIAADLHDDVGSNLSSIAIASQLIGRKVQLPDNEQLQLAEIGFTALRTAEMMKEIVWLINPKNDLVDDLILKMKAVAGSLLQGISYSFNSPQHRIVDKIDLETKRNLYMMYKEILNNIVRHASASEVSIIVGWQRGRLSLIVKDNGKGFDVRSTHEGNGLRNLHARNKAIGGELSIVSAPASGTTVSIELEIT